MKNIIFIFLLCWIFPALIQAQDWGEYSLNIKIHSIKNVGNGMRKIDYKVFTVKGSAETELKGFAQYDVSTNEFIANIPEIPEEIYSVNSDTKPDKIRFYTRRAWGTWPFDDNSESNTYFTLDHNQPYINKININTVDAGHGIFPLSETQMDLKFCPRKIRIWYFNGQGAASGTQILPKDDNITLKATKGFISSTYNWQYSTNGTTWYNFPSGVTYGNNKSEVTFKGSDLLSLATFKSLINNGYIYVRINTVTSESSPYVIVLSPCLSVPKIQHISYDLERCYNSKDAVVKVTFNRALESGEVIYITQNSQIAEGTSPAVLDGTNTGRLPNVSAGTYRFGVSGSFNGYLSYNESPDHSRDNVTIVNRPKINHSIIRIKPASCFSGSDGEIAITANGGTDSFVGRLFVDGQSTALQTVNFNQNATFTRLQTSGYNITIYDYNGCEAFDNSGNELIHRINVTQPAEPVQIAVEHILQPKGYDTADGEAIIRVSGGTHNIAYAIQFTSVDGQSYVPASLVKEGASWLYRFIGLRRGDHAVAVQDQNFSSLITQDQNPPCGCSATFAFYIPAPPPLELEIKETHVVNCYGRNEGELTVHARGGVPFTIGNAYQYTWYRMTQNGMQVLDIPDEPVASDLIAGTYQVKITDANGITKISDVYILVEPEALNIAFETINIGCFGDNNGGVKSFVTGGTLPYRYQWNIEGGTEPEISLLEAGIYMLKITDVRQCQLTEMAEVKISSGLVIDSVVRQPTCLAPSGGSIVLNLSGATPPYSVQWEDVEAPIAVRNNLPSGIYRAMITDANQCKNRVAVKLNEIHEFSVTLGEDVVMCLNQSRMIEALSQEPSVVYEWYYNNVKLPDTEKKITIDKAGTYSVKVINPQGCFAIDNIDVEITEETLDLVLAAPTVVAVGSEIHAVNISLVKADKITWNLPEEAKVIALSDMEAIFSIDKEGTYDFSMEGFKGEGASIVVRTLQVTDENKIVLPDSKTSMIKQFLVMPNPSKGIFKVLVELNQPEDITLLLFTQSGLLVEKKEITKIQSGVFDFNVSGYLLGNCFLLLQTTSDQSIHQIILTK